LKLGGLISFEIPAGKMVCVVGPTGCGKSTLIALLTRLYDPDSGTITLGGKDIRSFPVADLRRAVGNVFSTTNVFTGSLADNMALGMSDVTREQIEDTGRAVGLDAFARKLSNGYDTMIGIGGEVLEREELGRLAFARAVLSNPKVLTVDDTFAAFSEDVEEQLRLALELHLSGRTIIIATSRYSICEDADVVLVMRKGGVVQIGSHLELMRQPGLYNRMYSRQMGLQIDAMRKP